MDTASLLMLLFLGVFGWYWLNSSRALDIARNIGRKTCGELGLQFLDDTVASTGWGLARNESGRRVFRRTYRFEFSETGNSRREGQLILMGDRLESITMEPYEILD